jgi:signal peptidase I
LSLDASTDPRARRRGIIVPVAIVGLAILLPVAILVGTGFVLGWRFQPIESDSMAPQYPAGSLAVVQPIDPSQVEPGMTIVFIDPLRQDRQVAHRVVRIVPAEGLAWETKGDANAESDPLPVHANALQGRVAWVLPGIGALVTLVRGPQAIVLLVVLPLLVLVVSEVAVRRGAARRGPEAVAK